jgi:hypothetical protein
MELGAVSRLVGKMVYLLAWNETLKGRYGAETTYNLYAHPGLHIVLIHTTKFYLG